MKRQETQRTAVTVFSHYLELNFALDLRWDVQTEPTSLFTDHGPSSCLLIMIHSLIHQSTSVGWRESSPSHFGYSTAYREYIQDSSRRCDITHQPQGTKIMNQSQSWAGKNISAQAGEDSNTLKWLQKIDSFYCVRFMLVHCRNPLKSHRRLAKRKWFIQIPPVSS